MCEHDIYCGTDAHKEPVGISEALRGSNPEKIGVSAADTLHEGGLYKTFVIESADKRRLNQLRYLVGNLVILCVSRCAAEKCADGHDADCYRAIYLSHSRNHKCFLYNNLDACLVSRHRRRLTLFRFQTETLEKEIKFRDDSGVRIVRPWTRA